MSNAMISRTEFFKLVEKMYQLAVLKYPDKILLTLYDKIDYQKDFYFDTLQILNKKVIFYFTDQSYDDGKDPGCRSFNIHIPEKEKERDKLYNFLVKRKQLKEVAKIMTKIIFDLI